MAAHSGHRWYKWIKLAFEEDCSPNRNFMKQMTNPHKIQSFSASPHHLPPVTLHKMKTHSFSEAI